MEISHLIKIFMQNVLFHHNYGLYSFELIQDKKIPPKEFITCVFVLIFGKNNTVWLTKNHRGWELPGGHIESGESPTEALIRELKEELGVETLDYQQIAYKKLQIPKNRKPKLRLLSFCTFIYCFLYWKITMKQNISILQRYY